MGIEDIIADSLVEEATEVENDDGLEFLVDDDTSIITATLHGKRLLCVREGDRVHVVAAFPKKKAMEIFERAMGKLV